MKTTARPKWKVSSYRPFAILERDPDEATYETGDDKYSVIVNVHGMPVEQKERAFRIIEAVNSYDQLRSENEKLRKALADIAAQHLTSEIEPIDGEVHGDFEGAYDIMIGVARAALEE